MNLPNSLLLPEEHMSAKLIHLKSACAFLSLIILIGLSGCAQVSGDLVPTPTPAPTATPTPLSSSSAVASHHQAASWIGSMSENAIAVQGNGTIHIIYHDPNVGLRYATATNPTGSSSWTLSNVDNSNSCEYR